MNNQEGYAEKKMDMTEVQNIDVKNSQVNTSWYVPEATIIYLLTNRKQSREMVAKLIIGYKAYLLGKVTRKYHK